MNIFELIFACDMRSESNFILSHVAIQMPQHQLMVFAPSSKTTLTIYLRVYFWDPYSILLVYISIYMLVQPILIIT